MKRGQIGEDGLVPTQRDGGIGFSAACNAMACSYLHAEDDNR